MPVEITIPSPGESITEVVLGPWHKSSGQWVEKDEMLVEIESDKVTMEVPAPETGLLEVVADEGAEMPVGAVIGRIDTSASPPAGGAQPAAQQKQTGGATTSTAAAAPAATAPAPDAAEVKPAATPEDNGRGRATSLARKIAADRGVDLAAVRGSGPSGRIRKADVLSAGTTAAPATSGDGVPTDGMSAARTVRREKMTRLRQRIAERLVSAQHTAAMLTTFNEVDMSAVMALRRRYKDAFAERHGVGLGFMSFFVKASVSALLAAPRVNASIVGEEVEYHDYVDISVAVGTDKGLVVPVIRSAEAMSFATIEATIKDFAGRANAGRLTMEEMTGGTFTISNGGVYGSLNSTPILNPPQSAILGMHRIVNRPVEDADNPGQIVLRPMMNLALSYDHRLIDGAEAVSFLVHVRQCIEQPERMMLDV